MSRDDYLAPYRQSVSVNGATFASTLWASHRSQVRRFEVLAQMCRFAERRVLDAGCGRGDFAAFLLERGGFASYTGIDAIAEVIDFARQRPLPRCEFVLGDFVRDPSLLRTGESGGSGGPEVVCISGALNTMSLSMAMEVLDSAWAATGHALLFNFLSDRAHPAAPPQHGPAYRLDTMRLIDWALSRTSQIALRHDYFKHGHDATILMRKSS